MNRKTTLFAMAMLALASTRPALAQDSGYVEPVLNAVAPKSVMAFSFLWSKTTDQKWRKTAKAMAKDVVSHLGNYAKVHVTIPQDPTPFETAIRGYLVESLTAAGASVQENAGAGVHTVEVTSQAVARESRERGVAQHLDQVGKRLLGQSDLPGPGVLRITGFDVALTVTVKAGDALISSNVERFSDNSSASAVYNKPPKTLRLVGDK